MQLETSHDVNRHLNGEVEDLVLKVDALQRENEAHRRHADELTEHLARERREREKLASAAAQQSHVRSSHDHAARQPLRTQQQHLCCSLEGGPDTPCAKARLFCTCSNAAAVGAHPGQVWLAGC